MAAIRALADISKKWARVAGASTTSYEEGVTNPLRSYSAGAIAANDAWKGGVTAAVSGDRFASGVRKAGDSKWSRNAVAKGPARYSTGVAAAQGDYEAGYSPYREAIQGAVLPPRGPRRSPQNMTRVTAVVNAVSARKEALLKGTR